MKFGFTRHIFEKYSNIKIHENLSSGSRVVRCGGTDGQKERHEEANCRFTQFIERTEMGMTLQHLGESQQIRCG
jgi:hypothetical protein